MNSKDLSRDLAPETRTSRRRYRRGPRSPYSAFALSGVRRFERTKQTFAPFRIY
jgi:hypothetical protein